MYRYAFRPPRPFPPFRKLMAQTFMGSIVLALNDIVTNGTTEMHVKVLQTILPLLSNYPTIHGEMLAEVGFE
jgi:hypothetical protein